MRVTARIVGWCELFVIFSGGRLGRKGLEWGLVVSEVSVTTDVCKEVERKGERYNEQLGWVGFTRVLHC
jgi:hypothetical protein